MSQNEILVLVGGLFFGYWIVSFFLNSNAKSSFDKYQQNETPSSSHKTEDNKKSSDQQYNEKSSVKDDYVPTSWFKILEVVESASLVEISAQYKRKIREYHPDKVDALGKELKELAEFKTKEINSAYAYAKKLRDRLENEYL